MTGDIARDYTKLSQVSEVAMKLKGKPYKLITIRYWLKDGVYSDLLTFHPNGKCGCVLLDDEYMFGIRCDHLMWADGTIEGTFEPFINDNTLDDAVLLYGNHKGQLITKMLIFESEKNN